MAIDKLTFHATIKIDVGLDSGITPATISLWSDGGWYKSKADLIKKVTEMLEDHLQDKLGE